MIAFPRFRVPVSLLRDAAYSVAFYLAPRLASALTLILVARMAGPALTGRFSLAVTFLVILTTLTRGLDDLIVREVSREPLHASTYLFSFMLVRLALALLLYFFLAFIVLVGFRYEPETSRLVLIVGLSVVPDSVAYVGFSVLLGLRRFLAPSLVLVGANLLRLGGAWFVILHKASPDDVGWVWVGGGVVAMLSMSWAAFRASPPKAPGGIGFWGLIVRNWQPSLFFLSITTMTAMESQIDTLLLSVFHDATAVGWYGSATTLAFAFLVISQAYRYSVFPLMARYAVEAPRLLRSFYEKSVHLAAAIALPIACCIWVFAPWVVRAVYGPVFEPTVPIFRVLGIALIFLFLVEPNSRLLLALDQQKQMSKLMLGALVVNTTANLILVPGLGGVGAALARLTSSAFLFLAGACLIARTTTRPSIVSAMLTPIGATLAMLGSFRLMANWPVYASFAVGIGVYSLALALIGKIRTRVPTAQPQG